MKRLALLMITSFCILSLLSSCKSKKEPSLSADGKFEHFGEQINDKGAITVSELISKLETQESVETKVKGTVTSVCKVKGCWMDIKDENGASVFVKFKDYGFFMPLDCEGREVVMRGKGYKEVTSVDELRHYAEDEGKSKEEIAAITEPVEELKFMADGVVMMK